MMAARTTAAGLGEVLTVLIVLRTPPECILEGSAVLFVASGRISILLDTFVLVVVFVVDFGGSCAIGWVEVVFDVRDLIFGRRRGSDFEGEAAAELVIV
jgi:hypothetical protein